MKSLVVCHDCPDCPDCPDCQDCHGRSVGCIGAMCMRGYIGACCRHGRSVGERPTVLLPVNASPFVEGHVLQTTVHSARLLRHLKTGTFGKSAH